MLRLPFVLFCHVVYQLMVIVVAIIILMGFKVHLDASDIAGIGTSDGHRAVQ